MFLHVHSEITGSQSVGYSGSAHIAAVMTRAGNIHGHEDLARKVACRGNMVPTHSGLAHLAAAMVREGHLHNPCSRIGPGLGRYI